MADSAQRLAEEIADLRRRLAALERSSQLSHASIEVDGEPVRLKDSAKDAKTAKVDATQARTDAAQAIEDARAAYADASAAFEDAEAARLRAEAAERRAEAAVTAAEAAQTVASSAEGKAAAAVEAANNIGPTQITDDAIKSRHIAADAVTARSIAAGSVAAESLAGEIVLASDLVAGDPLAAHLVLNEHGLVGKAPSGDTTLDFDTATGGVRLVGELATGFVGEPRVEVKRDAYGAQHVVAFHGPNEVPGVDRTRITAFDHVDQDGVTRSALAFESHDPQRYTVIRAQQDGFASMEVSRTEIYEDGRPGSSTPAAEIGVSFPDGGMGHARMTATHYVTSGTYGEDESTWTGSLTEWYTPRDPETGEVLPGASVATTVEGITAHEVRSDRVDVNVDQYVWGDLTATAGAYVQGSAQIDGSFGVLGSTTLKALTATTLTTSGNLTVNGSTASVKALTTTGAATVGGNLTVNGASTLVKALTASGNLTVQGSNTTVNRLDATTLVTSGGLRAERMTPSLFGPSGSATESTSETWRTITGGPSGTFVAPMSGVVRVDLTAYGRVNPAGAYCNIGIEVRSGGTVGSGTVAQAPYGLVVTTSPYWSRSGAATLVTGLVPGQTYNVRPLFHCGTAGSSAFASNCEIVVTPQP